jgi:hypothetical protein
MDEKYLTVGVITLIVVGLGIFLYGCTIQTEPTPKPTPIPESTPEPTPSSPSIQKPPFSNECEDLVNYSAEEYYNGWKKTFSQENKLSDLQFNTYITVIDVSLRPKGLTCDFSVRYTIEKDWLVANRVDDMTLGVPPTITPDNLPLESDPSKPGRIGVSTINLHDQFYFKSETEALNYFVNAHNLKRTGAKIQNHGFQYFWNKEAAEKSNYPFAGEGGEAFVLVSGTISSSQNKCYKGELSLTTKETTYTDTPCRIS